MYRDGSNAALLVDAAPAAISRIARPDHGVPCIAIVGLGYVGLPTALAFYAAGYQVLGVEVDGGRRRRIASVAVDLIESDRVRLQTAVADPRFGVVAGGDALTHADVVVVCVPTPVDRRQVPDTTALDTACAQVVAAARAGQLIILTSTSYVGCTRELLVEPLRARGLHPGRDVHVAYCPERIDPGRADHDHQETPRVVGGSSPACSEAAARILGTVSGGIHVVSSPEAAEMSKLVENSFRAVNIALANEYADVADAFSLDATEVIDAAATKPYGFMAFRPGPGVGGHCIPCDPHYLLWQLRESRLSAPVIEHAMVAINGRPVRVAERALAALARAGVRAQGARIVLVGLAYKSGVQDVRESPAAAIAAVLRRAGVEVSAWDPHVEGELIDEDGVLVPNGLPPEHVDLAMVLTVHPDVDHRWLASVPAVMDASYQLGPVLEAGPRVPQLGTTGSR